MRDLLLIAWLALLSATRIDFLGGAGPLVLTPFLVFSPILVLAELWHLAEEGWELRVPPRTTQFLLAVSVFLGLLLISTFLSYDLATAGRRFALLFVQISFVFVVMLVLANRPDPGGLLLKGAYAALGLSLLFDLGQLVVWLRERLWPDALEAVVSLEVDKYLGVIPRFTGVSHDPNLGGLVLVFAIALIVILEERSLRRDVLVSVGALAVLLTLSRSAALAGLALWGCLILARRQVRVGPAAVGAVAGVMAVVTAAYLLVPGTLDPLAQLGELLGNRLSLEEGSTSEHVVLLARGWEVATENVKHALLGIGYGNAYLTVQDIFPGNEYGNYHSLFVTIFAEAGAVAGLFTVWIFGYALWRAGPYWPLIAALIAFNLFQQAHTNPLLWVSLMAAWLGVGLAGRARSGEPEPGMDAAPRPRTAPRTEAA